MIMFPWVPYDEALVASLQQLNVRGRQRLTDKLFHETVSSDSNRLQNNGNSESNIHYVLLKHA